MLFKMGARVEFSSFWNRAGCAEPVGMKNYKTEEKGFAVTQTKWTNVFEQLCECSLALKSVLGFSGQKHSACLIHT